MSSLPGRPKRSDFPWVADEVYRLSQEGVSAEEAGKAFGVERIMANALLAAGRERAELERKGLTVDPPRLKRR